MVKVVRTVNRSKKGDHPRQGQADVYIRVGPHFSSCNGKREDNAHLTEVADRVTPLRVTDRHYVEKERLHVVVQRFVVQEELRQQTEVLAVLLVAFAIYLPDAYFVFPITENVS